MLVSLSRSFSSTEIVTHMHACDSFASKYYSKRNIIAHDAFKPHEQGVEVTQIDKKTGGPKEQPLLWTADELRADIASIDEFRGYVGRTSVRLASQPLPRQAYDDIGWNWGQPSMAHRNLTLWLSSHNSDQPNSELLG
jgi:hypothetical protein